MKSSLAVALLTASLSSSAIAAVSQVCPSSDSNLCYSLNVPDATASSGSGDIYFQISAPSTYSWVALGQGKGMSGSNMFIIYSSADGQNVTLSPRLGKGEVMPLHDTQAQVTLLEGSGIKDGKMVANVKCTSCNSWTGGSMDFTQSSVSWIYAAKTGPALNSGDVEESIVQHDLYSAFNWDMSTAKGGSSINPFVSTAANGGSGTGTATAPTTVVSSSSGGGRKIPKNFPMILMAHGVMAAVAFTLIFPIGGIIIRVANFPALPWVHAAIQIIGWLIYTAAFGLGVYIATCRNLITTHHPIIGIIIFALLVFQPVLGLLHHRSFQKTGKRGIFSFAHLGVGRVAIILGIINGGLGLRLANNAKQHWLIVYGVVGGVFGVAYIASIVFGETKRAKNRNGDSLHEKKNVSDREGSVESGIPLHHR